MSRSILRDVCHLSFLPLLAAAACAAPGGAEEPFKPSTLIKLSGTALTLNGKPVNAGVELDRVDHYSHV